ncbi:hypothetical protein VNO77_21307 [Canavalia gladiata]|uniref:Uncharacterized protein n=1 Tax=Canavalia gladiata TaxID=3824 RepID=A0AAN9LQT6_CANGL
MYGLHISIHFSRTRREAVWNLMSLFKNLILNFMLLMIKYLLTVITLISQLKYYRTQTIYKYDPVQTLLDLKSKRCNPTYNSFFERLSNMLLDEEIKML